MDIKNFSKEISTGEYDLVLQSLEKQYTNNSGETYLFVVGIDDEQFDPTDNYCSIGAERFIQIFWKNYNVKRKNTYSLINENATKANILSYLENFDNVLGERDQLFIYFVGYGHHASKSNFFIPSDGKKRRINSCISNQLISRIVTGYTCDSVFLHFNLDFDIHRKYTDNINSIERKALSTDLQLNASYYLNKVNYMHHDFLKVIVEPEDDRMKQSFMFFKEVLKVESPIQKNMMKTSVNMLVERQYRRIRSMLKEKMLSNALMAMERIVYNNDNDVAGRLESLRYALDKGFQLEVMKKNAAPITEKEIGDLALEVLNKIEERGFYLLKTPRELAAGRVKNPKKILFAAANPRDQNHLRLKDELRAIEFELLRARYRDDFVLIKSHTTDIRELQENLLNDTPQFIHFCGHGNCEGIALLNNEDEAQVVKNKPLADLFRLFATDIHCIFLNSCHSIEQSKEISKHIDHVICMNSAVPDELAIHFATAFYQSIGAGKDIKLSFQYAKNSAELHGLFGTDIPVLLPTNDV